MLKLYINSADRTGDLQNNTLQKSSQNQQRADDLNFTLFQGSKPNENQTVRLFMGDTILTVAGATITLSGYFQANVGKFYPGQKLYTGIGTVRECKNTVLTYTETADSSNRVTSATIVLTASPSITPNVGDLIGELIFGGVTSRVQALNVEVLQNLEYQVQCVSFDKLFDKKLLAGSYSGKGARYIINDQTNININYNALVDTLSYASNGAIQAVWIEAQDGGNPTVDASDYLEGTASAVFPWTFSAGTAKWEANLTSQNVVALVGVSTGAPTKGNLMIWGEAANYTKITGMKLRIGSSAANYAEITIPKPTSNIWGYNQVTMLGATIVGTPDWTAFDYAAIVITENGTSSIKLNGFRINAEGSFTLYNVVDTPPFTTYQINNIKPTASMDDLGKYAQYVWDIDYERDIHFAPPGTINAPFNLSTTSANFHDLQTEVDQSQVGNRIIVNGGLVNSTSLYSQVFQGDDKTRSWLLYTKYNNLTLKINDGTGTHAAEVGTTTTNIKWTAHGLATGDWIVNTTRSNTARQITKVDNNNFTVQAITAQTSGDTITWFNLTKTIGIDGVDVEASYDYMGNYQNQSIRASTQTATLPTTSFLLATFYEKIPIQVQYADSGSAAALKALGLGDGIFDLQPITDNSIQDTGTALARAQAQINQYKNPVVQGSFVTDQDGLKVGQIININDSYRGFNADVMIQTIQATQNEGSYKDYFSYSVSWGTTLFGLIEFFEKLIRATGSIAGSSTSSIVELFVTDTPTVGVAAAESAAKNGGFKSAKSSSTINVTKTETCFKQARGSWHWETSTGQNAPTRWNLFDWA